MSNFVISSPEC